MNKKIFKICLVIVLLVVILILYPKRYDKEFSGIIYRLGKENQEYFERVSISFDGKLTRLPILNNKYIGDIIIGDMKITEITLVFDSDNSAMIFDSNLNTYGQIYFDNDYKSFTIAISEQIGSNSAKGWDGSNGLMISAPASSREEALNISNKVMKSKLLYTGENYLLE